MTTAGTLRPPPTLYLLMFLLHGLLTTSHLLGIVYSGVLLVALIFLDLRVGRFRPLLYASGALSWTLLIPERYAIRASAAVGKPWFWTLPPDAWALAGAFCGFSALIGCSLLVLATLCIVSARRRGQSVWQMLRQANRERPGVYVVMAALLLVPVLFGFHAHLGGTSLFTERYLLPVMIAPALLFMELTRLVEWQLLFAGRCRPLLLPKSKFLLAVSFAVCLSLWVFHLRREALGNPDYETKLSTRLPTGLPVLCEDAWSFVDLVSIQHGSGTQYTYLLDWAYSASRQAPKLEVTQYHLMENWKKVGYFSGSIRYRDEFLRNQNVFLLLNPKTFPVDRGGRAIGNPLLERFIFSPGYEVRQLSKGRNTLKVNYGLDQAYDVWMVCRFVCPK